MTGGTDGIGYATAKRLARLGMTVIIGDAFYTQLYLVANGSYTIVCSWRAVNTGLLINNTARGGTQRDQYSDTEKEGKCDVLLAVNVRSAFIVIICFFCV